MEPQADRGHGAARQGRGQEEGPAALAAVPARTDFRSPVLPGTYDTDLFVIGAGSGGVRAARIAASHGARVTIAEQDRVGGTCVIRGCVPKKLFVIASRFADDVHDAAGFGWSIDPPSFSWPRLLAAKDEEIDRLEAAYVANLDRAGVSLVRARAEFRDAHTLALSDGRTITAGRVLIAVGGAPRRPKVPGVERAITSDEVFHLQSLPKTLVIVGGGYIGVEFACLFQRLGVKVTLVYRGELLLRGFDDELRRNLANAMSRAGIEILCGTDLARIDEAPAGHKVTLTDGQVREADTVMLAVGRSPASAGLGLEHAGIEVNAAGAVVVDDTSRTSAECVWAVGDVTNRLNLTPVAIREGHAFADSVFGGRPWQTDYRDVASAVFATPELGTVGLTEAEAKAKMGAIDIYKTSFRSMRATLGGGGDRVLMKLVVDAETDRVLGVHILGEGAAEMVQCLAIAVKMKATKADFDATMPLHPSAAEELVTLRTKS